MLYHADSESISNMDDESLIGRDIHLYKYRWLILTLYSLTAFSNTLVWLSLFTVTDATSAFYQIDDYQLLWSSNAFTFMQVIIAIPVSFIPSRFGLRTTMVVASAINAMGACVMIAATHRGGFVFFVLGQTIIAVAASILPQLAPAISATWFGVNEHAISTSIGIILGNAGAAVGFLQPALMISNINVQENIPYIGEQLKKIIISQAVLCIVLMILVFLFFKNKPVRPPTKAEAVKHSDAKGLSFVEFRHQYKILLKDINYHLCGNSYALSSVLLIIVPVILNNIMSWKFPNRDATIGWMGFAGIIFGIIGSVIFGFILDKTKAFKTVAIFLGLLSLLLWIAFTESLAQMNNLVFTFILFVLALFIFVPFGPILVDVISEMTYPVPESISYVVPITMGRLYSIPFMFLIGWLIEEKKFHFACLTVALIILICCMLVIFTKVAKKRTLAGNETPNLYEVTTE